MTNVSAPSDPSNTRREQNLWTFGLISMRQWWWLFCIYCLSWPHGFIIGDSDDDLISCSCLSSASKYPKAFLILSYFVSKLSKLSYIMQLFTFASKYLKAFLIFLYLCPSWKNIPKISQCLFDFVIFVSKLEKYPKISQCLFDFVTFCFQAERHMMANNWPCTQSLFYWTITRFNCQQNTHFQSYRDIVVYICISAKHIYKLGDKVRE